MKFVDYIFVTVLSLNVSIPSIALSQEISCDGAVSVAEVKCVSQGNFADNGKISAHGVSDTTKPITWAALLLLDAQLLQQAKDRCKESLEKDMVTNQATLDLLKSSEYWRCPKCPDPQPADFPRHCSINPNAVQSVGDIAFENPRGYTEQKTQPAHLPDRSDILYTKRYEIDCSKTVMYYFDCTGGCEKPAPIDQF